MSTDVGSPEVLSQRVDPGSHVSLSSGVPLVGGGCGGQEARNPSPVATVPSRPEERRGLVACSVSPQGRPDQQGQERGQVARSSSPMPSPSRAGGLVWNETVEQVAPWSLSTTSSAGVTRSTEPCPSSPVARVGSRSGEHMPQERTMKELVAFGGISDSVAAGRCVSHQIQGQPDADDL